MVADADHGQAGGDAGLDIIPDIAVGMSAAEMVRMKVELHDSVGSFQLGTAGYSELMKCVSGMPFRSPRNCCIAELTYRLDL